MVILFILSLTLYKRSSKKFGFGLISPKILISALLQALTITGDKSNDCTEEVCRDMNSNSDELWEQCGGACVQRLLELSCENDDECSGVEDKEVSVYITYFKYYFHLCSSTLQSTWKVYLEINQWTDLHIKYVVLRNVVPSTHTLRT